MNVRQRCTMNVHPTAQDPIDRTRRCPPPLYVKMQTTLGVAPGDTLRVTRPEDGSRKFTAPSSALKAALAVS